MHTCRRITELATDYLEDAMPPGRRILFSLHLMLCPPCREYLRQMRLTVGALAHLPRAPLPADQEQRLRALYRGREPRP